MTPDKFVDTVRLMGERMKELETILKRLAHEHNETYRAVFIGDDDPAIRAVIRGIPKQVKAIEALEKELGELKKQLNSVDLWVESRNSSSEARKEIVGGVGRKVLELVVVAAFAALLIYFGWDKYTG